MLNSNDNKGYTEFEKGSLVKCVNNERTGMRKPAKLTINNLYAVIECIKNENKYSKKIMIKVLNDEGVIETYTTRRFITDRECIIANLLD